MNYGPFEYEVTFDGSVDWENDPDIDAEAATADMPVKSAEMIGMGDATNIE